MSDMGPFNLKGTEMYHSSLFDFILILHIITINSYNGINKCINSVICLKQRNNETTNQNVKEVSVRSTQQNALIWSGHGNVYYLFYIIDSVYV